MSRPNRREVLATGALAAGGLLTFDRADAQTPLAVTPECREPGAMTIRQTEGPYFKPSSPERTELIEPGMAGEPIELAGLVLTRACRPVPAALLDFWHADDKGLYDNTGFRLRGHQYSDEQGRFRLRTIMPAVYEGRTRHFHVKVQGKGGRLLTTQLYFPGEPQNSRDGLFRRELLMRVAKSEAGVAARFDFILDMG